MPPALALAALLCSCAPTTTAFAPPPVPPLHQEIVPKPPVSAQPLIWQPGHWDWNGSGYVWVPGMYVPIGTHGNMWMPGYWQENPTGWQWVPAHWL